MQIIHSDTNHNTVLVTTQCSFLFHVLPPRFSLYFVSPKHRHTLCRIQLHILWKECSFRIVGHFHILYSRTRWNFIRMFPGTDCEFVISKLPIVQSKGRLNCIKNHHAEHLLTFQSIQRHSHQSFRSIPPMS